MIDMKLTNLGSARIEPDRMDFKGRLEFSGDITVDSKFNKLLECNKSIEVNFTFQPGNKYGIENGEFIADSIETHLFNAKAPEEAEWAAFVSPEVFEMWSECPRFIKNENGCRAQFKNLTVYKTNFFKRNSGTDIFACWFQGDKTSDYKLSVKLRDL